MTKFGFVGQRDQVWFNLLANVTKFCFVGEGVDWFLDGPWVVRYHENQAREGKDRRGYSTLNGASIESLSRINFRD